MVISGPTANTVVIVGRYVAHRFLLFEVSAMVFCCRFIAKAARVGTLGRTAGFHSRMLSKMQNAVLSWCEVRISLKGWPQCIKARLFPNCSVRKVLPKRVAFRGPRVLDLPMASGSGRPGP